MVDNSVNVEGILNNDIFTLFPNPGNGIISIISRQKINKIRIIDELGKIISEEKFSDQFFNYNMDISESAQGFYIISVETESNVFNKKYFKN